MILTNIGSLHNDKRNERTRAISPAYHSVPKSVKTNGKTRTPREARGKRSIHFLILFGSFSVNERKYGTVRGIWVTRPERIMINSVLFIENLLIGEYE